MRSACAVVELEVAGAHLNAVALEVARHAVQDHGQQRQQQRRVVRALAEQLRHVEDELQARRVGAAAQAHRQLGDERAVLFRAKELINGPINMYGPINRDLTHAAASSEVSLMACHAHTLCTRAMHMNSVHMPARALTIAAKRRLSRCTSRCSWRAQGGGRGWRRRRAAPASLSSRSAQEHRARRRPGRPLDWVPGRRPRGQILHTRSKWHPSVLAVAGAPWRLFLRAQRERRREPALTGGEQKMIFGRFFRRP